MSTFIEPNFHQFRSDNKQRTGSIEVICGSMFSGKTEELIRRLTRARIARQKVEIFKPSLDKRYHEENVVSHNENSIRSTPVNFAHDILLLAGDCDVVGIDEAQFLDEDIVKVVSRLANAGKRVILAGLDMDFAGKPFGSMPQLMAIAEYVSKMHAICMVCGDIASHSYRLAESDQQVMLGEKDAYEARCRKCFNDGMVMQQAKL